MKGVLGKTLWALGVALSAGAVLLHLADRGDEASLRKELEAVRARRRAASPELLAMQGSQRKREEKSLTRHSERSRQLSAAWSAQVSRLKARLARAAAAERSALQTELTKADKLQRCAAVFGLDNLPGPPPGSASP